MLYHRLVFTEQLHCLSIVFVLRGLNLHVRNCTIMVTWTGYLRKVMRITGEPIKCSVLHRLLCNTRFYICCYTNRNILHS